MRITALVPQFASPYRRGIAVGGSIGALLILPFAAYAGLAGGHVLARVGSQFGAAGKVLFWIVGFNATLLTIVILDGLIGALLGAFFQASIKWLVGRKS